MKHSFSIKYLLGFALSTYLSLVAFDCWAATTYYIAANGSDSNNGTSKSTPWLHAPGMTGCSGNCASHTPASGDSYILKGGDTWHNSASGQTPTGVPWLFSWSGASDIDRISIGVDQTWFTGETWTRPKLNGDNPLSTSSVSSCTYRWSGTFITLGNYITLDNIEFLGLCWSGTYADIVLPKYINLGTYNIISNAYMHGWTHQTFDASNFDGAVGIRGWTGDANDSHNIITKLTVDGSDSDRYSFNSIYGDCWNINNSTFRYVANGPICNNAYLFYNNLIEYIYNSADPGTHSNGFEMNSECTSCGSGARIYNNLIRHVYSAVGTWTCPMKGQTSYYYNNVFYDIAQQVFDWDGVGGTCSAGGQGGGTGYFYNNTIVGDNDIGDYLGRNFNGHFANNHWVGTGTIYGTPLSVQNELHQTPSQATSQGYVSSNNYAPSKGSGATVNAGSSILSSIFNTDILGVTRPQNSTWDIGAYEHNTLSPMAPLNLSIQ